MGDKKMIKKIMYRIGNSFFRCMDEYDITLDELKQKQANGAVIVDVRNNREYNEGHINGSINIPEYEINRSLENKIKNKGTVIVMYCSSGWRSKNACKRAKNLGYSKVFNLYGGLERY